MKPTQTVIAVALALVVIAVIFIFPGLSPFPSVGAAKAPVASSTTSTTTSSTTMPTANTNSVTQLEVTDTKVGTGATAEPGDTVTVNYVGSLTDGTVFDASANHGSSGFSFTLGSGQVIKGWDEGIVGMKVGGTRKLVIPASLGYGSHPITNPATGKLLIPANSTLVFDVQLLSVKKPGK